MKTVIMYWNSRPLLIIVFVAIFLILLAILYNNTQKETFYVVEKTLNNKIDIESKTPTGIEMESETETDSETQEADKTTYANSCFKIYNKLRYPNMSLFFNPPLEKPPEDLMDEFTQHGEMPIKKWWYINDVYSDSKGGNTTKEKRVIEATEIEEYRKKVKDNQPLNYGDHVLNELMHYFEPVLRDKSLAVIGTQIPWIEAIGLEVGCSSITTLDYTRAAYKYSKLNWLHVNDYLDNAMETNRLEEFDTIVSFSSLEHSGLGRYGDPINPNGDIEAVKQIHCMLKPGGLFFLALPTNNDGSSHIEFNAHRVYGTARLNLLFKGWKYLMKKKDTQGVHTIFVLQKILE
jgi:hypothetical protein